MEGAPGNPAAGPLESFGSVYRSILVPKPKKFQERISWKSPKAFYKQSKLSLIFKDYDLHTILLNLDSFETIITFVVKLKSNQHGKFDIVLPLYGENHSSITSKWPQSELIQSELVFPRGVSGFVLLDKLNSEIVSPREEAYYLSGNAFNVYPRPSPTTERRNLPHPFEFLMEIAQYGNQICLPIEERLKAGGSGNIPDASRFGKNFYIKIHCISLKPNSDLGEILLKFHYRFSRQISDMKLDENQKIAVGLSKELLRVNAEQEFKF